MTELCEILFSEVYIGRLMYVLSIALVLNTNQVYHQEPLHLKPDGLPLFGKV